MVQLNSQNFIIDQAHLAYQQFRNAHIDQNADYNDEDYSNEQDGYSDPSAQGEQNETQKQSYNLTAGANPDMINITIEQPKQTKIQLSQLFKETNEQEANGESNLSSVEQRDEQQTIPRQSQGQHELFNDG